MRRLAPLDACPGHDGRGCDSRIDLKRTELCSQCRRILRDLERKWDKQDRRDAA